LAAKAQSDGNDILFADNADNKIPHEIELFNDSTGQLVVWVKVANLSSSVDTVLYLYYGNAGAADQQDTVNVWNSNYLMIQHLEETTGTHYDSTANNNDGTAQGGLDQSATGKIAGADDFAGDNDWIEFGSSIFPASGAFTVSAWVKADAISDHSILSTRSGGISVSKGLDLWFLSSNLSARVYDNGGTYSPTHASSVSTWYYVTAVYDGANIGLYVNDLFKGENAGDYNGSGASTLGIGNFRSNNTKWFNGIIDEVRISNTERPADWVKAEYRNQSSPATFYSVGSEELNPLINIAPDITDIDPNDGTEYVSIDLDQLSFTIDDPEDEDMDYNVTTSPNIGTDSNTAVSDGTYIVAVSGLAYNTTYNWTVDVNDGNNLTSETYSFTTEPAPASWYNNDWHYRKRFIIDKDNIPANLENFPFLIDIIDSNVAAVAQADGNDILFTDYSGAKLSHEIELYEIGSPAHIVAWLHIPLLSSSQDTILYMYYGNLSASNQQNPTGVWDANYVMVHHLHETSGTHNDSTSYNYDASPNGSIDANVYGKIGKADDFLGTNGYLEVASFDRSSDSQGTIEAWVKLDDVSDDAGILQYFANSTNRGKIAFDVDPSNNKRIRFNLNDEGGSWEIDIFNDSSIASGTWYHVAGVQTGTTSKLYINGAVQPSTGSGQWFDDLGAGTAYIGTSATDVATFPGYLDGIIDEVRVSKIARSGDWLSLQYQNQNNPSNFYSIGTQEPNPFENLPPVITDENPADGSKQVSINLTELTFTIDDPEDDDMDYTVTTDPAIGSDSNTAVSDGTYSVSVSGLAYGTTY
ncbi:MAG: DUF2341 domain-containing protein, partial [Planctomycetota bacterium]